MRHGLEWRTNAVENCGTRIHLQMDDGCARQSRLALSPAFHHSIARATADTRLPT